MFDKITSRIQKLCYGLNSDFVDPVSPITLSLYSEGFTLCTLWPAVIEQYHAPQDAVFNRPRLR